MSEVLELSPLVAHGAVQPHGPYLVFSNPGTLEIELVKLMGVSVKESSDPIGFFGTGLKYAMAAALRLGGSLTIFTGGKRYDVGGQRISLREKEFTQITLNGEALGFTTELGKQWEAWMVVRELYSNALDEAGKTYVVPDLLPNHRDGETLIALHGECFQEVWKERSKYFLASDHEHPIHTSTYADVYPSHGDAASVFYRGIRIHDVSKCTRYKYNLIENVILTEDRTLKYEFQLRELIEKTLIACTDKQIIWRCLTGGTAFYEGQLSFASPHSSVEMSAEFIAACSYLLEKMPDGVNKAALRFYQNRTQTSQPLVPATLTTVQHIQLLRAIDFVKRLGCDELDSYPIEVVRWLGEGIHGRAQDGLIHISIDCFDRGTKYLASTIFEEFVHSKYGYQDESRALQTYLFDRIVSMGEEFITGEPL